MKALLLFLLAVASACAVQAQQVVPVNQSDRTYISYSEAAPKIFAAAIARSPRGSTDPSATVEQSYRRALEYSKHIAYSANVQLGADSFSYFSWLPSLMGGQINAETVQLTVGHGSMTGVAFREVGAFHYQLRPHYQSVFTIPGKKGRVARVYDLERDFTFKNEASIRGANVVFTNRCTSTTAACSMASVYEPGRYKWMYRPTGSNTVVYYCDDVSDCVQADLSWFFHNKTWKYRTKGIDDIAQYWGNYSARPPGNCSDSAEYGYLQSNQSGVLCPYSLTYESILGLKTYFSVTSDDTSPYFRYVALNPVPLSCPGATKYPHFAECDKRFSDDAITPHTLARLVGQMFYWGSFRQGYAGHIYTPVVVADVIKALGSDLVKLSSLAETVSLPVLLAPNIPANVPGGGQVDLGTDPGIDPPKLDDLEHIPDAGGILAPIWGLFPSLRSYSVGSYSVQCPEWTPSVLGTRLHIDAHCKLAEGQRAALGALSLVAWAATALLVVLKA